MKSYDSIVIGGGIGGLSLALLLGLNKRKVLLLEKSPAIGGGLSRFFRQGVPLDTGFHFTGGLQKGGVLDQMFRILGLSGDIQADPICRPEDNRFILESSGNKYDLPPGFEATIRQFKRYFPEESEPLEAYFSLIREVNGKTASLNLETITELAEPDRWDRVCLQEVMDGLFTNPELKTVLAGYSMCYGVPATDMSFANHARVVQNLHESITRIKGGGQAIIAAFKKGLAKCDVEIRTRSHLAECRNVDRRRIGTFVLNTGEEVATDECIFTIHPRRILETLPEDHLSRAFAARVDSFEPSVGFFSLYAEVENAPGIDAFQPAVISLFPGKPPQALYTDDPEKRPLVVMKSRETDTYGRQRNIINAFELSFPADVAPWRETRPDSRPPGYLSYKAGCNKRITERILTWFPEFRDHFVFLDSASMLTFRDYFSSPHGCAYGIKQKMGQFNLFGRVAFRNVYAAGQNATLPGLVGTMLSSFILTRSLLGRKGFKEFVGRTLGGACQR